jgi:DNA-binding transcriptional regulator YiaG
MKNKFPEMSPRELMAIRAAAKKKQREMAEILGVNLRTYQRWEGGERKIPNPVAIVTRSLKVGHENVISNSA